MLKPIVLTLAGLLWTGLAHAQESIHTSGGDASGSGGSAAYSVGQVFYTSNTGSNGNNSIGLSFTILTRASNWSERLVQDKPYLKR